MFKNFLAPIEGRLVALTNVPDSVFAQKIMGDGFAIDPSSGKVISPVNGTITSFMADTQHAVGITAEDGTEVLIHIGIDTVSLCGAGFVGWVGQDDSVTAGQTLLTFDMELIRSKVPSLISPVVFINLPEGLSVTVEEGRLVKRGDREFFAVG
jgi:PTS system D-glucosamine-specific IIC component